MKKTLGHWVACSRCHRPGGSWVVVKSVDGKTVKETKALTLKKVSKGVYVCQECLPV